MASRYRIRYFLECANPQNKRALDLRPHHPTQLLQKEFFAVLHARMPIVSGGGIGIVRNVFE
jgi:hypothetical protein